MTIVRKRVAELEGAQLDFAVLNALGYQSEWFIEDDVLGYWYAGETDGGTKRWCPSSDWHQGGPIIEREGIEIWPDSANDEKDSVPGVWFARAWKGDAFDAGSPLIAAMRAFVASKLGDEVEVLE